MKNIDISNIFQWPFKHQLIVLVLIFVAVFGLGYYFDTSNQRFKLTEVEKQEDDLKQQLNMAISKENALESEITKYESLLGMLKEWKNKLIHYSDLPPLMDEILKVGANNHITFSLFKPQSPVPASPYIKQPIQVIAVGSYHQLGDFISQVANMNKIVAIDAFLISNENLADVLGAKLAEEANTQNLLTAKILFDVYMIPEQKKP